MTGKGYDAILNVVLVVAFAVSVIVGLIVAGIAWIFTTGTAALCLGALVPLGLFLVLFFYGIKGLVS